MQVLLFMTCSPHGDQLFAYTFQAATSTWVAQCSILLVLVQFDGAYVLNRDCLRATGYNVTRTMGVAMAKLSPRRGFAAELATALVILVASQ